MIMHYQTIVVSGVWMWKIEVEYATHVASHFNHDGFNLK
jgi:hypothetical protein